MALKIALRRKQITQRYFHRILVEKYGWKHSHNTTWYYCNSLGVRDTPEWETIRLCAKQEFGIEYRNGRWEVNSNG